MWWYFIFEPRGWLLTYLALAIIITVKRILQPVYAPDWLAIVDVKNDLVRVQ